MRLFGKNISGLGWLGDLRRAVPYRRCSRVSIFASFLLIFFLSSAVAFAAPSRKVKITVTNKVAGALSDFQVKIVVPYDADMQADFDDISFRADDESTSLNYWLESKTNSTTATFWVEVPTIAAGVDTTTDIYMYYGDAGASSGSSVSSTFLDGDDFSGTGLDGGWTEISGTDVSAGTVSGGTWTKDCGADASVECNFIGNDRPEAVIYRTAVSGTWEAIARIEGAETSDFRSYGMWLTTPGSTPGANDEFNNTFLWGYNATDDKVYGFDMGTNTTGCEVVDSSLPTYLKIDKNTAGSTYTFWQSTDGDTWTQCGTFTDTTARSHYGLYVSEWVGTGPAAYVESDYFIVKKYAATEPTTSLGSESVVITPNITVTESSGSTAATEGGTGDSFTVVLDTQPTDDVTIDIACSDATKGCALDQSSLTFTDSDWDQPQTVNVTAINDGIYESSHNDFVLFTVTSNDNDYDGMPVNAIEVTLTDNESVPTVTLDSNTNTINEFIGFGSLTATLSHPSASAVTVNLIYSGTAIQTTDYLAPNSITISSGDLSAIGGFMRSNDSLDEDDESFTVEIDTVDGATESGSQSETITITDDDNPPEVTLDIDDSGINEAGEVATVTATLSAISGRTVTVNLSYSGTATGGGTDYTASGTSIVIAAGDGSGTATVSSATDSLDEDNETILVDISSITNGTEATPQQVSTTIADDDALPNVNFTTASQTVSENGVSTTISVILSALSGRDVTVPFSIDGASTATGSGNDYSISSSPAMISAGSSSATISVTLNNDVVDENSESIIVNIDSPTNANAISPSSHTITLNDNDSAAVVVAESGGGTSATEGGSTDSYTIVLATQPASDVTVTLTPDADVSLSAPTLTFTSANWSTPQSVTVTAVNDSFAEGSHSGNITHSASSSDGFYNGISIASITVSITDNDSAGVSVSESDGATALNENDLSATDSFTVVLTTQPSADVTISLSNDSDIELSASSLTFTSANWSTPQEVEVSAVGESGEEEDYTSSISFTVSSGDSAYNDISVSSLSVAITVIPPEEAIAVACGSKSCVVDGACTLDVTSCEGYVADTGCSYSWSQSSGTDIDLEDSATLTVALNIPSSEIGAVGITLNADCDAAITNYTYTVSAVNETIDLSSLASVWLSERVVAANGDNLVTQEVVRDNRGSRLQLSINDSLSFLSSSRNPLQVMYLDDGARVIIADPSFESYKGIVVSISIAELTEDTIDVLDTNLSALPGVLTLEGLESGANLGYRLSSVELDGNSYVAALMPGSEFGTVYLLNEDSLEIEYTISGSEANLLKSEFMLFPDLDHDESGDLVVAALFSDPGLSAHHFANEADNFELVLGADLSESFELGTGLSHNISFSSQEPIGLAEKGDLNEDGYDDMVLCEVDSCACHLYFGGDEDAEMTESVETSCDEDRGPSAIAIGDYSGDGVADIALLFNRSDNIYLMLGSNTKSDISFANSIKVAAESQNFTDCLISSRQEDAEADGLYVCVADENTLYIEFAADTLASAPSSSGDNHASSSHIESNTGSCSLQAHGKAQTSSELMLALFASFSLGLLRSKRQRVSCQRYRS